MRFLLPASITLHDKPDVLQGTPSGTPGNSVPELNALTGHPSRAYKAKVGARPSAPTESRVLPQIQAKDDFLVVHLARALETVAFIERDR
jgi:hypothetical protein